jgi:hypothetical protein
MPSTTRSIIPWVGALGLLGCATDNGSARNAEADAELGAPVTSEASAQQRGVAPEAAQRLREMSEYLAGLDRFALHTEGTVEEVLDDGQTLAFPYASDVKVSRKAGLRSDRLGEKTSVEFYYDGESFTLYGKDQNVYATAKAPPTLDAAIDAARQEFGIEAPGADLLYADPYAILTEDVVSGFVVGQGTIDGVPCDHLAFRGNEVDWQIWIEDGPEPVPRRFAITSKKIEGSPEFVVELSDWDTDPGFTDEVFEFRPPRGAREIEFQPEKFLPQKSGEVS